VKEMAEEKITRTYTIPLRRGYAETPRYKRTNKAVRVLKEFLAKHMKSEDVRLGKELNEYMWAKGIQNPPPRVSVIVTKDKEGIVRAELEGKVYTDFKQQDKKEEPKSMKEKLQSKVKEAKTGTKKETATSSAQEQPATPPQVSEKSTETKATTPAKETAKKSTEEKTVTPAKETKPVEKQAESVKAKEE
jgi:large subunit ribosomal protein L31e